jgi:hypothetical protein
VTNQRREEYLLLFYEISCARKTGFIPLNLQMNALDGEKIFCLKNMGKKSTFIDVFTDLGLVDE